VSVPITEIRGRPVYDSNGTATIEVDVVLSDGSAGRAMAQRGSTTGEFEASVLERTDSQPALAAVEPAIRALDESVAAAVIGLDGADQEAVDAVLDALDETPRKEEVGGNVTVATSMAVAWAGARALGLPLHRHLGAYGFGVPSPVFNMVDGAAAEGSGVPHVEFLLFPAPSSSAGGALEGGGRVRRAIQERLQRQGTAAGDSAQGAVSVALPTCEEGLELLLDAAAACGFAAPQDFTLGLDLAGSDWYSPAGYRFPWARPDEGTADMLLERYATWAEQYFVTYVEDAFAPSDVDAWVALCRRLEGVLVAGDDLFASSPARIVDGAREQLANAAVVKPNQVGTVTGALEALRAGRDAGLTMVVSQRSGETGDALITHLAVAGGASYLKAGGVARMDRIEKFNELLRIEESIAVAAGPVGRGGVGHGVS
jgi:enolase